MNRRGEIVEVTAWSAGALTAVVGIGFGLFVLGRNITRRIVARRARGRGRASAADHQESGAE